MAAKIKVDQIETVDATDSITINNTVVMASGKTLPAASLTGTLPAISGANLTNLPADATKLPLAGGTLTGALTITASTAKFKVEESGGSYGELEAGGSGLHINAKTGGYITLRPNGNTEAVRILSNGKVGIGETAPLGFLHVKNGDSGQGSINAAGNSLVLESNGSTGITFLSGSSSNTSLVMGDSESNYQGVIIYDHSVNAFKFATTGTERMRIDSSGKVGIGNSIASTFSGNANTLVVGSGSGDTGMTIYSGNTSDGAIFFADSADNNEETRGGLTYDHNTNKMQLRVNDANRLTIDNAGNVGINVEPDSELTTSYTNLQFGTGLLNQHDSYPHSVNLLANAIVKNSGTKQINTSYPSSYFQQWNGTFMFKAEAAGNAAITWSECLKVWNNTSSGPGFTVGGAWNTNGSDKLYSCHVENNVIGHRNVAKLTDTQTHWRFYNPNGSVGTITTYGSATSFNTSSDYRLKENVNYTWDATTRLKQLKPARFNFIADDTNTLVDGFIAHEVSSVVPEAIHGVKDAMEAETFYTADDVETQGDSPSKAVGDVKTYSSSIITPQGIDQSKLVPLLVKTIQELEARITALEA